MTTTASKISYTHEVVASADGVTTFNIALTFTPVVGDLPEGVTGVFVKRIGAPTDPKTDTFVRVAVLSDLGKAATSRDIALDPTKYKPAAGTYIQSAGNTSAGLYLTPSLTMAFDNLTVAIRAKELLEQRVDSLITSWKTYRDQLYAVTETAFPLQDSAVVAAAKNAYYAAVTALEEAQASKTAADTLYSDSQSLYDTKNSELQRVQALQPYVCTPASQLAGYSTSHLTYFGISGGRQSLLNGLNTALSESAVPAAVKAAITNAITAEATSYQTLEAARLTMYDPAVTAITAGCTTLTAQASSARQATSSAQNAMDSSSVARSTATALVAQRQTEKDLALASVLSVCPSFTP